MRRMLVTLLLPAILLAQAAAGMSPGRSICIVLDACCGHGEHAHGGMTSTAFDCGFARAHHHGFEREHAHAHERAHKHGYKHAHSHAHPHAERADRDSAQYRATTVRGTDARAECERRGEAPCDGSDCHFHVSTPDEAGTSRAPTLDCALVALPAAELPEALVVAAPVEPARPAIAEPPDLTWPHSDQRQALETDRLLI